MRHFYAQLSDNYSVAVLIKDTSFKDGAILNYYLTPLMESGVPMNDVIAYSLEYDGAKKVKANVAHEYIGELLPALVSTGVTTLFCTDSEYFKKLTGKPKATPHAGEVLPCVVKGFESLNVILGVNHGSILYNPNNEGKLIFALNTLANFYKGQYTKLGSGIIQHAEYPDTVADTKFALDSLHQHPELSVDIETFSLRPEKAGIGTITFCWSETEGIAFACDYVALPKEDDQRVFGKNEPNLEIRALLKQFFIDYTGSCRYHRANFDVKMLLIYLFMTNDAGEVQWLDRKAMVEGLKILTRNYDDTRLIAYLALNNTAERALSLKDLAHEYAGNWANSDIKDITKIPLQELLEYNLIDGLSTNYVYNKYYPIMQQDQQEDLYNDLFMPSQTTVIQVETVGMPMSRKRILEVEAILENAVLEMADKLLAFNEVKDAQHRLQVKAMNKRNSELKTKQHTIEQYAHLVFNPNSGAQQAVLLYDVCGLPIIEITKGGGPATDKDTLKALVSHAKLPHHKEILELLIEYSNAAKILSTFIPAFKLAFSKDGSDIVWLHGSFTMGGTVSGRMSSSEPNLQNLPSGSKYGKIVKSCFVSFPGYVFCGADFNSLEDYISALTTKDPAKMQVYLDGYDGHSLRAYSYWPDKFTHLDSSPKSVNSIKQDFDKLRSASKAPTFALTYGGTSHALMKQCGFSEEEAKNIEARYHELYKVSDAWVASKIQEACDVGYTTVAFGLRVRTPLLARCVYNSKRHLPFNVQAEGRTVGNAQGQSYGLLNNRALVGVMKRIWASEFAYEITPVALIHDALYFVCPDTEEAILFLNTVLVEEMQWQDLPELEHDKVKLGAALDIFYPTWKDACELPNYADAEVLHKTCEKHLATLTS